MAARKRLRLALKTRERIRTSMLINRLQDHVFGKCEMTPTQVKSALAVLRKTLPDLKPIKVEYEDALSDTDAIRVNYDYGAAGKADKRGTEKNLQWTAWNCGKTFKAGHSGNPLGGQKGSRNKQTLAVADRLEALGCDPIEGMALIAMDESADPSLRAQMFKELAQYIAPKRKAVEMQAEAEISLVDVIRSIDEREDHDQTAQS